VIKALIDDGVSTGFAARLVRTSRSLCLSRHA